MASVRARRPRFLLTSALAFALASALALASANSLSLEEYLHRLQETASSLERGTGEIDPEESEWLRERLPQGLRVRDAKGGEVEVNPNALFGKDGEALRADKARERLIAHLNALKGQIPHPAEGKYSETEDWEGSRETLHALYQTREFRHLIKDRSNPWMEFLLEKLRALNRWLEEHLSGLPRVGGGWMELLVYGLVISLIILIIWWVARAFGAVGWLRGSPRMTQAAGPGASDQDRQRDWSSWREEARRRAKEGAFREAIRCLFISVLLEGHQRGWWVHEAQATNREYLARLAGRPQKREPFQGLLGHYERAWYGLGQPKEEEFRACEACVLRMGEAP